MAIVLDFYSHPSILYTPTEICDRQLHIGVVYEGYFVRIGCQEITVTLDNIEILFNSFYGKEIPNRTNKCIIPIKSSDIEVNVREYPLAFEETPNFYVSKTGKSFSKKTHIIKELIDPPSSQIFIRKGKVLYWGGTAISESDAKKIEKVLLALKEGLKKYDGNNC